MRRLSQQAARWHHLAVYRSSLYHPGKWRLQPLGTLHFGGRQYAQNARDNPKVRVFEPVDPTDKKNVRELDPETEGREEQEKLLAQIRELDSELEEMESDPYGPNSDFMRSLSKEDRAEILEALREAEAEELAQEQGQGQAHKRVKGSGDGSVDDLVKFNKEIEEMFEEEERRSDDDEAFDEEGMAQEDLVNKVGRHSHMPTAKSFEVKLEIPPKHQAYVDRFNTSLKVAAEDTSDPSIRQDLWKWYQRCKQTVPSFLSVVPDDAWPLLWNSQSELLMLHNNGAAHLIMLAEDILASGKALTALQWLTYIECLLLEEKTDQALEIWKSHEEDLSQEESADDYWSLGVRLFTVKGSLEDAQESAQLSLKQHGSQDPRILIPIISGWSRQTDISSAERAWALYLRLKTALGESMKMEDYDTVSTNFLNSGRTDLALAVFKDMIVSGQSSSHDSTALYKAALGLVGDLQGSGIVPEQVNKVSLAALTILPREFQNKFFYGSWMKKLIGMGEVDGAAMVVELMYERGVKPDTRHLNGIIGAWLRFGDASSKEKAERMGWAMIQERIDFVWQRQPPGSSARKSSKRSVQGVTGLRIPPFLQRTVPRANIETFSVLLLYYTRRSMDHVVRYLTDCLQSAEIRPNAYFMNHLLYSDLRKQDLDQVWKRYSEMTKTLRPDLETFACLWDCGKVQYDRSKAARSLHFPSARGLYREMRSCLARLPYKEQEKAREEFSKELYDQIIRCFCLSKDLEGTLVAMYGLKDLFNMFPDEDTARMIVLQVARLQPVDPGLPKRRRRNLFGSPNSNANIAKLTSVLEELAQQRQSALAAQRTAIEDSDGSAQKEHQLGLLSDFLRVILRRVSATPSMVDETIEGVAEEMGVQREGDLPFRAKIVNSFA